MTLYNTTRPLSEWINSAQRVDLASVPVMTVPIDFGSSSMGNPGRVGSPVVLRPVISTWVGPLNGKGAP